MHLVGKVETKTEKSWPPIRLGCVQSRRMWAEETLNEFKMSRECANRKTNFGRMLPRVQCSLITVNGEDPMPWWWRRLVPFYSPLEEKSIIKSQNTGDVKWLRFLSNPNSKETMDLMLRHRCRMCAESICWNFHHANSINYLLMFAVLANPNRTRARTTHSTFAPKSGLRTSTK